VGAAGTAFPAPFLDLASRQFEAKLNQVDFRTQSESARAEINDWVSQATKGKITDLIQRGVLNPLTRLVLVNAIYFKGEWAAPFKKEQTSDQPFSVTPENKVTVALMHRKNSSITPRPMVCNCSNFLTQIWPGRCPATLRHERKPFHGGGAATGNRRTEETGGFAEQIALDNWLAQRRPQKSRCFCPV